MKFAGLLLVLFFFCGGVSVSGAADNQIIAGASASTELVRLFVGALSKRPESAGISISVMEGSVTHAGGIKHTDFFIFGRSGRPLNKEELAAGKKEVLLGRVPIGFATGLETGVKRLPLARVKDIFTRNIEQWKEVGGVEAAVTTLGLAADDGVTTELKNAYPWFRDITFDLTFRTDEELVKYMASSLGRHAITFGAKTQFRKNQLLDVPEVDLSLKVGLIYDRKNENHPLVQAAKQLSSSKAWKDLLVSQGYQAI
jgi:hypothetical protein